MQKKHTNNQRTTTNFGSNKTFCLACSILPNAIALVALYFLASVLCVLQFGLQNVSDNMNFAEHL